MIREYIQRLLDELPGGVEIVAAAKGRTPEEVMEAVDAGIKIIGENYVQEAERAFNVVGNRAKWHFIGHLQKNKVKKAVRIFDMIETIDSLEIAREIDRACAGEGKTMQVLIEVNSGRERQKFGVMSEDAVGLIQELSDLQHIKVVGLMTMGPMSGDPEEARPYFVETRKLFEQIKRQDISNIQMGYLSMGMSNSYRVAIEEGANIIRIGTKIFGKRERG